VRNRSPEMQVVLDTCLTHAEGLPPGRRALLYRGLAEFCGDAQEAADLASIAADLEDADRRCREFAFRVQIQRGAPR
jgi:hypothetical protein